MTKTKTVEKKPTAKEPALRVSEMTLTELTAQIKLMKEKIIKFQLDKFVGKAKNVREGFVLRKNIARMLTALSVKKLI